MKSEEGKPLDLHGVEQIDNQTVDRLSILELFNRQANDKAEDVHKKKLARERDIFELNNGKKTSVFEEREKLRKVTEELPQNHEPKFRLFFPALGKLANWTDEEMKAYHKPALAAKTIIEVIYDRFPKDVMLH